MSLSFLLLWWWWWRRNSIVVSDVRLLSNYCCLAGRCRAAVAVGCRCEHRRLDIGWSRSRRGKAIRRALSVEGIDDATKAGGPREFVDRQGRPDILTATTHRHRHSRHPFIAPANPHLFCGLALLPPSLAVPVPSIVHVVSVIHGSLTTHPRPVARSVPRPSFRIRYRHRRRGCRGCTCTCSRRHDGLPQSLPRSISHSLHPREPHRYAPFLPPSAPPFL